MTAIDLGNGFRIVPSECDGYVCWKVTGSLDLFRCPRLSEAIATACLRGSCHHLVDLTEVEALDASALRELIGLHKLVRSVGRLAVAALPGSPAWSLLVATGAARILGLFTERLDAAAALQSPAPARSRGRTRACAVRVMISTRELPHAPGPSSATARRRPAREIA